MQAIDIATTDPRAPYDCLRPMRCRAEPKIPGRLCDGRGGDIDWGSPGTHGFRCPKCGAFNVVYVPEAQQS